jgi:hypothetical protein
MGVGFLCSSLHLDSLALFFLYYVDPMCNLIFVATRFFTGYKLMECYHTSDTIKLIEGFIFPLIINNISCKIYRLHLVIWKIPQDRRNLGSDTTVMFPSHYSRSIMVLGVFLNFFWLWYFIKHFSYSDSLGYS